MESQTLLQIYRTGRVNGLRVLTVTRKGAAKATVLLAPMTAEVLDVYVGNRTAGPLFTTRTREVGTARRHGGPFVAV